MKITLKSFKVYMFDVLSPFSLIICWNSFYFFSLRSFLQWRLKTFVQEVVW